MPLGATRESLHIKMEAEEPHPEGAWQGDGALGTPSWVSLSQGSKEKALFLPGGGEDRDGEGCGGRLFVGGSCGGRWRFIAQGVRA